MSLFTGLISALPPALTGNQAEWLNTISHFHYSHSSLRRIFRLYCTTTLRCTIKTNANYTYSVIYVNCVRYRSAHLCSDRLSFVSFPSGYEGVPDAPAADGDALTGLHRPRCSFKTSAPPVLRWPPPQWSCPSSRKYDTVAAMCALFLNQANSWWSKSLLFSVGDHFHQVGL